MNFKRIISFVVGMVMCLSLAACGDKGGGDSDYTEIDYNYTKESETMLKFSSSDADLDHFLNDYLHRHLRYDNYRIGDLSLGSSVMFNKEWEAMSLFFFDSTSNAVPDDRVLMMENYLYNIPVDKFGYTWQAFDNVEPTNSKPGVLFGQGWPFPAYNKSAGNSTGWEWNSDNKADGWTASVDGAEKTPAVSGGVIAVDMTKAKTIEFVSPATTIKAFHSPFLELDIRMNDALGFATNYNFDDIYVYWQTSGDTDFSESKMVKQSDFATLGGVVTSNYMKHLYFPMYMHPAWGRVNGKNGNTVTKIKIVVRAKQDAELTGSIKMNYVRGNYDTRHTNNGELLLRAGKLHYEFTGKADVLADNLARYRKAILFLLEHCNGKSGLIDQKYFVGHEGTKQGLGTSIGQGYWDILSTPDVSLYNNIYFYKALESMIYLEKMAAAEGIEQTMPTVAYPNADGTCKTITYDYTAEKLQAVLEKVREAIQAPVNETAKTGFWDEEKGRLIEGFNANGEIVDYGFIMFNLEAVAAGITTDEQSKKIMSWVAGERIVESDIQENNREYAVGLKGTAVNPDGSFKEEEDEDPYTYGIYDFEFAPRSTTVKNKRQYFWSWGGQSTAFGEQVQDGGAIMYLSYYDIMSRISARGADDRFERLKDIQKWYNKVEKVAADYGVDEDGDSMNFYRVYYKDIGIDMQGNNTAGGVGLDYEFLESALLYASVPYGFFGIRSEKCNVLNVQPNLPSSLNWWKLENLTFNGVRYDLTIGKNFAQIDYVRGDTYGLSVDVKLAKPSKSSFKVYVDGKAIADAEYAVEGDTVTVNLPLRAERVEIR